MILALPQKLPDWIEPPWMTTLKRLGKDPAHEVLNEPEQADLVALPEDQTVSAQGRGMEVPRPACAERDVPPVPLEDVSKAQSGPHLGPGGPASRCGERGE